MPEVLTTPVIRAARLPDGTATPFRIVPDAAETASIAEALDLVALRKVRLEGVFEPLGRGDWRLSARLGATAVQRCVVTLEPVTTRIDQDIARTYLADGIAEPEGESEMPEDDTVEALPDEIDLLAVLTEGLALALPDYPRAEGVELDETTFTAPGVAPLTDDDVKPFAALKVLKGGSSDTEES